jgi:hypothetical protein
MMTVEEKMAIVSAQVQGLSHEEVRHTRLHSTAFWSKSAVKLTVPMFRYIRTFNDNKHVQQSVNCFNSFSRMDDHHVKKTNLSYHS